MTSADKEYLRRLQDAYTHLGEATFRLSSLEDFDDKCPDANRHSHDLEKMAVRCMISDWLDNVRAVIGTNPRSTANKTQPK